MTRKIGSVGFSWDRHKEFGQPPPRMAPTLHTRIATSARCNAVVTSAGQLSVELVRQLWNEALPWIELAFLGVVAVSLARVAWDRLARLWRRSWREASARNWASLLFQSGCHRRMQRLGAIPGPPPKSGIASGAGAGAGAMSSVNPGSAQADHRTPRDHSRHRLLSPVAIYSDRPRKGMDRQPESDLPSALVFAFTGTRPGDRRHDICHGQVLTDLTTCAGPIPSIWASCVSNSLDTRQGRSPCAR